MIGIRKGNQYQMTFKVLKQNQALLTEGPTMREWHEKLGHVNFDTLRKIIKENAAIGLNIEEDIEFDCEACN